jgi:hypothetical protein
MLRRALVALSLANLCFIPAWREVVDPGPLYYCYHAKDCPLGSEIAGVTLDALLLAALFFAGFELARRIRRPLARRVAYAAFLLTLLVPLNGLRIQSPRLMTPALVATLGRAGLGLCLLALAALALAAVWRVGLGRFARGAAGVVLILSPFIAIAYAQSLWKLASYQHALDDQPSAAQAAPPKPAPGARVVWIIFDELDYRAAFDRRPASLQLPELDRLRGESLFAAEAYPPAGTTLQSLPALISGKLVAEAKQTRPDDLAVRFHEEKEFVGWRTRPNIFSRLREEGMRAALAGAYHPYCRMFGAQLARCHWVELSVGNLAKPANVSYAMSDVARMSFLTLPVLRRLSTNEDEVDPVVLGRLARHYRESAEAARSIAADPSVHLAFIHLPVPHPPAFYDRARGRVEVGHRNSYLDSLALADRTLGELRRAMEEAGVWDSTAVLVSSDHWWRAKEVWSPETGDPTSRAYWTEEDARTQQPTPDYRVPFILKLPGQASGFVYGPAFNTVLSHDLVLALVRGEVSTPEDAAGWLDQHRSFGVSPYKITNDYTQQGRYAGTHP